MEASNVQKMLEAFDEIIEKIDAWRTDGTMEHWQYSQLFDIADAALALPLRQCDVGTAEEQGERQKAYCRKHFTPDMLGGNCRKCPLRNRRGWSCQLAWAQEPYVEKEGGAK